MVGSLLSSPPAHGALKTAIRCLAAKTWSHPVTGRDVHFSAVTIERWYYTARRQHDDPVGAVRRAVRKDRGKVSLAAAVAERLVLQYRDHPHWSYQLHYDNLAALVKADPSLGPLRSYSTVRRYMQAHGLVRKPRLQFKGRPGEGSRGKEAPDTRDPQLRSRARRGSVAPRGAPRDLQLAGRAIRPAPDVLRLSPSSESLRDAFRLETKRIQRQSDGTISLEGAASRFRAGIVTSAK